MGASSAAIPLRRPGVHDASRLLTAEEVAERLRVTTGWVYAATRSNRLPHVRLGRYVRFRADAIERWVAELEANGRPEGAPQLARGP